MPKSTKKSAVQPRANADLSDLERCLGHTFVRRELLENALTHSSHANEASENAGKNGGRPLDNEQLEFLGDAVLGFITSKALFERYPDYSEGQLSKIRAHLVSARHLLRVAKTMFLGQYLRLGRGEERSGGRSKSALLVDALEAVIAAQFLDGGQEVAKHFVMDKIVNPELNSIDKNPDLAFADQKSALQEWLQATGGAQPSYHLVQEDGPDHRKTFTVELLISPSAPSDTGKPISVRAQGQSKKKAEQKVAQKALSLLRGGQDARPQ